MVMKELSKIDEVDYVRFEYVYRRFKDIKELRTDIESMEDAN